MHVVYIPKKISIHASAKEATIDTDGSKRYYWGFQSTPPRRRRRFYRLHTNIFAGIFQSTPPRRRRLRRKRLCYRVNQFQSTPPRRRRPETILQRPALLISIHASAKEATNSSPSIISTMSFQSTPPRRRRLIIPLKNPPTNDISIHASAKEATISFSQVMV